MTVFRVLCVVLVVTGCGRANDVPHSSMNAVTEPPYDWQQNVVFTAVPNIGFSGDDFKVPYYRDVMSRTTDRFLSHTAPTNAHETNHKLNAQIRNQGAMGRNVVYFENGKALVIEEPKMHANRVREFVPEFIKGDSSRYKLYLVDQVDRYWSVVLYQFDEWAAYRTDARVVVEADRAGTLARAIQNDICNSDGAIDFLYFGTAALRALSVYEPAYLESNTQFKAAFAMLVEQTVEYYKYGRGRRAFDCKGTEYFEHFVNSSENAANRKVMADFMGEAWVVKVFGKPI